jgi:hypothetical protein
MGMFAGIIGIFSLLKLRAGRVSGTRIADFQSKVIASKAKTETAQILVAQWIQRFPLSVENC